MSNQYPSGGPVTLKTNLADSALSAALKSGRVSSPIVRFDFCGPPTASNGFKAMVRDGAFKSDKAAAYHLVVQETGKCTLTAGLKGQSATVEVVSYDDAAEADLVLEVKDGKLTARRK